MMARRCTRSALAGAALALFIALAGWLLPEATPAAATGTFRASSVVITSDAGPDNTYGLGDTITLRVAFADHCVIGHTGGALAVTIGSRNRSATPTIRTNSTSVDFSYTVVGGDVDTDGITVAANALSGTWNTSNHVSCVLSAHDHGSPSITGALTTAQASHKVNAPATDYDTNDNNRIDITTLAQLNAIRHDLDGNGDPASGAGTTAYNTAFPNRQDLATGRMGCSTTCAGYELRNNLDFDTSGNDDVADAPYASWTPIGDAATAYSGAFDGNGHTIANLTINDTDSSTSVNRVGLFGAASGAISNMGLPGVSVTSARGSSLYAGALVGNLLTGGSVTSSWAAGSLTSSSTTTQFRIIGGLVGYALGPVRASYARVSVTAHSTAASVDSGGLVGHLDSHPVTASYATGAVAGSSGRNANTGGLVGFATGSGAVITASYSTGRVTGTRASNTGLVGELDSSASAVNSYWDVTASNIADDIDTNAPEGRSTGDLQTPTEYGSGLYANWNVDIDGTMGGDDPWDFGTAAQYPVLQYDRDAVAIDRQRGNPGKDYDGNNNNLIDITTLDNLNGIRYDLDGDGAMARGSDSAGYAAAFPGLTAGMGCPATCAGYELLNDLDFDTGNADDRTDDTYYNGGAGWVPIGASDLLGAYTGVFRGNGHTIANLFINSTNVAGVGLFGGVVEGPIDGVRLTDVDIATSYTSSSLISHHVGGLAGASYGAVRASSVTGRITTTAGDMVVSHAGGLVGSALGGSSIANNYASVDVTVNSTATATLVDQVGGLVGQLDGFLGRSSLTASYALGNVAADRTGAQVGGLAGHINTSDVSASYATGTVTGSTSATRGLIGSISGTTHTVTASYWDTTTSGIPDDDGDDAPEGKTTGELQWPTDYGSATSTPPIYASWNVNVDGDPDTGDADGNDDPWDFGTNTQYPVLKYGDQDICQQGRVCLVAPVEPEAPAEAEAPEAPPIIYNLNIRFDARRIALPEGHQASYRVRLAGPPSGSSKIRIRSDNPDVTPSPAELTFTAANWNQWQTVKISIAGDANSTDESATLAHYGPNRGYGSVLVSVTDTGDSRQAGDTPPPALTVITEPGARWGVTVTPTVPADLAAHGVVRVSSAYGLPRTATGYNLGRSGAAQAIVSIAAPDDVPASGLTVCLPVARALADEAGERPLTLLRYAAAADDGAADDGAAWQPVSGAEHNAAARSVCAAGVTGFGPFAAAYALPQ